MWWWSMYTFELDQTALVDGHRKGFLPGALPSLCQGRHGQTRRERTVGGLHRPLLGSLDGGGVIHSPHTRDCLIIECTRYTQLTSSIHPSPRAPSCLHTSLVYTPVLSTHPSYLHTHLVYTLVLSTHPSCLLTHVFAARLKARRR